MFLQYCRIQSNLDYDIFKQLIQNEHYNYKAIESVLTKSNTSFSSAPIGCVFFIQLPHSTNHLSTYSISSTGTLRTAPQPVLGISSEE